MTLTLLSALLSTIFLSGFVISAHLVSPFFIRFVTGAKREEDPRVLATAYDAFKKAGIRRLRIWQIESPPANAFVCGIQANYLPVRFLPGASLFITRSLKETLSDEEMQSVLLHEASHVALGHALKRAVAAVAFFLLSALGFSVVATIALLFLPQNFSLIALLAGLVAMIQIQMQGMKWLICRQEFQADRHAVIKLGATPSGLIAALRKLEVNSPQKKGSAHTHPPSEERIAALSAMTHDSAPRHSDTFSEQEAA